MGGIGAIEPTRLRKRLGYVGNVRGKLVPRGGRAETVSAIVLLSWYDSTLSLKSFFSVYLGEYPIPNAL